MSPSCSQTLTTGHVHTGSRCKFNVNTSAAFMLSSSRRPGGDLCAYSMWNTDISFLSIISADELIILSPCAAAAAGRGNSASLKLQSCNKAELEPRDCPRKLQKAKMKSLCTHQLLSHRCAALLIITVIVAVFSFLSDLVGPADGCCWSLLLLLPLFYFIGLFHHQG